MKQICKFNKERDIKPTVEGLAMDLDKAIESGEVMDTASAESYNNLEETDKIGSLVRDNFDAMDAGNNLASIANNKNVSTQTGDDE